MRYSNRTGLVKYRLLEITDNSDDGRILCFRVHSNWMTGCQFYSRRLSIGCTLTSIARIEQETEDVEQRFVPTELRDRLRSFLKAHFTAHNGDHRNIIFHFSGACDPAGVPGGGRGEISGWI
jgi:hypothetical protein